MRSYVDHNGLCFVCCLRLQCFSLAIVVATLLALLVARLASLADALARLDSPLLSVMPVRRIALVRRALAIALLGKAVVASEPAWEGMHR